MNATESWSAGAIGSFDMPFDWEAWDLEGTLCEAAGGDILAIGRSFSVGAITIFEEIHE